MTAARSIAWTITLSIALALISCSGDDDPRAAERRAATGPVEATTTTEPTFSGVGGEEFCGQAGAVNERLRSLVQAEAKPDSARTLFTSAARAVRSLAEVAPAEIAADARTVASAYESLVDGLVKADWRPDRISVQVDQKLNAPDVRLAGDRLQVYEREVCRRGE